MRLARATGRPERVVGTHFFNPVPLLPLVEVIGSVLTAESTRDRTTGFSPDTLGKQVIRAPDRVRLRGQRAARSVPAGRVRMVEAGLAAPRPSTGA